MWAGSDDWGSRRLDLLTERLDDEEDLEKQVLLEGLDGEGGGSGSERTTLALDLNSLFRSGAWDRILARLSSVAAASSSRFLLKLCTRVS